MLTQLEVFNSRVAEAPFPIGEGSAASDPLQIRDITGLGPVVATVNMNRLGDMDEESYSGSSVGKRAIVITLGLNPDWRNQTYATLRQAVYAYFMPKSLVRLRISSTHLPTVEISGVVESCEPTIFSQDQSMVVTILCPKPHFSDVSATVLSGLTVASANQTYTEVNYMGTTEVGFTMSVRPNFDNVGATGQVQIINRAPTSEFLIVDPVTIDTTQYLDVSTVPGDKYVQYSYADMRTPVNLLRYMSPNSLWQRLKKGKNEIRVVSSTPGLRWSLRYVNQYGGL